jgi:superfamily II DNA or RNA helicase
MPEILDNIELKLLDSLRHTLSGSNGGDFCVGYFNLRGWKTIDDLVENWDPRDPTPCRLLVGMQRTERELVQAAFGVDQTRVDQRAVARLKKQAAEDFREQLCLGVPTASDERGLRRLARQIKDGKVTVKIFLRHMLHAKLYLAHCNDRLYPLRAYLGSSNLTFSGLSNQGELNIDVPDKDATKKLLKWFEDRWNDSWCLDISKEIVEIIEESWAGETLIPPYHIYLKMAWHLSRDARDGVQEFRLPRDLQGQLQDFQQKAVQIACQHLNRRGGVMVGDVVGLGKTRIASAIARVMGDDLGLETLILCPKNLVPMWKQYCHIYKLRAAEVLSHSVADDRLLNLPRYRLVLLDESHNFRNREGKRYQALRDYIKRNDSRVVLISATPYNKSFLDLSSQLRLFIDEKDDIGIRPENLFKELGATEFSAKHPNVPSSSLEAFEKSEYLDDWRELMRLFLVRRTRSFIIRNYAKTDPESGRKYLSLEDGRPSYFPDRVPKTIQFPIREDDPQDQYAKLFKPTVVSTIDKLELPRYGLKKELKQNLPEDLSPDEHKLIDDLSRAGKGLKGFCRTNLFKRLESCSYAFCLSVHRHVLRNYVFLHALENKLEIPVGEQDTSLLDTRITDEDELSIDEDAKLPSIGLWNEAHYRQKAAEVYGALSQAQHHRYRWLRTDIFRPNLAKALASDAQALRNILNDCGPVDPARDEKLKALIKLVKDENPKRKFILFSQFADTVNYLAAQMQAAGLTSFAAVTGDSENPTALAWRFSPESNGKGESIPPNDELRVLLATDVLSEGQNLQDAHSIINFDMPWAIIRLIQRAGRVDRIGQTADKIFCYTFLPAEGVERVIQLRARLLHRLHENEEVVGSDETFFEDQAPPEMLRDLYNEKSGVLDDQAGEDEVDLVSEAYEIWSQAIKGNSALRNTIETLPDVVHATKPHVASPTSPAGALVYVKTQDGNDALAWLDNNGDVVTESQYRILKTAACQPDTESLPRLENHYGLVEKATRQLTLERRSAGGGQLGPRSGARFRTYAVLQDFLSKRKNDLFTGPVLEAAVQAIYSYPLTNHAIDTLNRLLRTQVSAEDLARVVENLHAEDRLAIVRNREEDPATARIICSMGLRTAT